jgi:type VII secretion-associated serine protease mycosin
MVAAVVTLGVGPGPAYADSVRSGEWQLADLHARAAWNLSTGSGVIVAVLDSGVDASHPDLSGQVLPGADFVDGSTDGRRDFVGHGTTVASLIAGRGDDSTGVEGLAPKARILPVRVLDKSNKYDDATTVAKGVIWAVDHGAKVINMSLGGAVRSAVLADAISYAFKHNIVVVACTGNVISGGTSTVWYPAREPGVLAVTGLSQATDGVTYWSGGLTDGDTVLSGPATNLVGAKPGGYWKVQGTSFAAPLVAAAAALVRAKWPTMSAANVINRLIMTADDLGRTGRDSEYGYGEVDPAEALTAAIPTINENPLLTISDTAVPHQSGTGAGQQETDPSSVEASQPASRSMLAKVLPGNQAGGADRVEWSIIATGILVTGLLSVGFARRQRRDPPPA